MAKSAPTATEAEYVVVGAGSAGCAVAGRLAESGASVILIEAGGPGSGLMFRKPGMIAMIHAEPKLKARFDWGFYHAPQEHMNHRTIPATRGKLMGGSSSVNGMIFVRGNRENFDAWEAEGNKGWGYDDVLATYRRLEDWEGGQSEYRGAGGPVKVSENHDAAEISEMFVEAGAASLGVPVNPDYNGESQDGMHLIQENTRDAVRYSTSRAYVDGPDRSNLHVQMKATVTKVVIEGGRATGVEVLDGTQRRVIRATREVIVSAGAYSSPHLLMLSGVGPAAHLGEHGIPVLADLPVGDNLHDHVFVPMTFNVEGTKHRGSPSYFFRGIARETLRPGHTFLAHSVFEAGGFVRTSRADSAAPDMQLLSMPWAYPAHQDEPIRIKPDARPSLSVFSTLIRPESRGTIRLASADPLAAPVIDPNFLAQGHDAAVILEGLEMIREVMSHPSISRSVKSETEPGAEWTAERLAEVVRERGTTVYHPVGSVRMGTDERAVVGPDLKVRGIEGLRVADASIMPSIISGNTNAPSIMIGEKCAELITGYAAKELP